MSLEALLADDRAALARLLAALLLATARVGPLFVATPIFGGRLLPAPLRVAIALAVGALLAPALAPTLPDPLAPLALVGLMAKELAVGGALAFLASAPLYAAEAAGNLADGARGAPTAPSPLGDLYLLLAVVVLFATSGHLVVLRAIAGSYEALPAAAMPSAAGAHGVADLAIQVTGRLIVDALVLAAPVLVTLLVVDLTFALALRAAPSAPVHALLPGARALVAVAVVMLALGATALALTRQPSVIAHDLAAATAALR